MLFTLYTTYAILNHKIAYHTTSNLTPEHTPALASIYKCILDSDKVKRELKMHQLLMTQVLESKERAKLYLSLFQDKNEKELRKRGYRKLPLEYRGIYKTVYLSHDHVVKVGFNAEDEWRVYQRHDSYTKRFLVPTVRLGERVILQPKGKPVAKYTTKWIWKLCKHKWGGAVDKVREQLVGSVYDSHDANFALFGNTILCIDFVN